MAEAYHGASVRLLALQMFEVPNVQEVKTALPPSRSTQRRWPERAKTLLHPGRPERAKTLLHPGRLCHVRKGLDEDVHY